MSGLPDSEQIAAEYQGVEPETWSDVAHVLLEHEAVRGFTFGAAGVLIAALMGVVHIALDYLPERVLPPAFIAPLINFAAVAVGVACSLHPLVDVSHGVHMAVQAMALYNLAHHATRKSGGGGDLSSVIRPPRHPK